MAWKTVDEMTVDEAENELYSLASYFEACAESGDGISSKDTIRYRRCCDKVEAAGRYVYRVIWKGAMILFLCYVFPPLAVLLMGRPFSALLNCYLTLFGWVPGVKHALVLYADRKVDKTAKRITKAIDHPKWTKMDNERSEARVRRKGYDGPIKVTTVVLDDPHVGMKGTQFRLKN